MGDSVKKTDAGDDADKDTGDNAVSTDLEKEIDAGVDATLAENEKTREEEDPGDSGAAKVKKAKTTLPPEEDLSGEDTEGGEAPAGEDKGKGDESGDQVADTLLERAVKAGLSLAEAKKCPSASLLTTICERLETAQKGKSAGDENSDAGDEGDGDDDPLAGIPDLDSDEYDEKLVEGFKALKGIARRLIDENKTLKDAGKDGDQTWFASKVSGLGEKVVKALEKAPEKRAELQEQYEVLVAGYKARDKAVDREAIFSQASATALSEILTQAKADDKTEKLRNREGKFISRPAGSNTKSGSVDAFDETAAELDEKYFKK